MHATGDDEDYVLSAIKGGYRILGFSDHTPWKYRTDYVADMRMLPEELPGYVESLKTLREKYHDRIDIRIGLECMLSVNRFRQGLRHMHRYRTSYKRLCR